MFIHFVACLNLEVTKVPIKFRECRSSLKVTSFLGSLKSTTSGFAQKSKFISQTKDTYFYLLFGSFIHQGCSHCLPRRLPPSLPILGFLEDSIRRAPRL